MIEEGRTIEKFVVDLTKTEGMTKEEKREYYIKLLRGMELARLQAERF